MSFQNLAYLMFFVSLVAQLLAWLMFSLATQGSMCTIFCTSNQQELRRNRTLP
jgi:hypothetical protein